MGRQKWKKIWFACGVFVLLAFTFWYGGGADSLHGFSITGEESTKQVQSEKAFTDDEPTSREAVTVESEEDEEEPEKKETRFSEFLMHIRKKESSSGSQKNPQNSKNAQKNANKAAKKSSKKQSAKKNKKTKAEDSEKKQKASDDSKNQTTKNPGKQESGTENRETGNTDADANTVSCEVSISCATLLDHMDELKENKKKLVPPDGMLLKTTTVKVKKGSSVFDVLCNATKANKVHLEYTFTQAYKSYYIEGIGNLYAFDCGELSGWMYSVNGKFSEYGCSSYTVQDGDVIKWLYTCDYGKDVGDYFEE